MGNNIISDQVSVSFVSGSKINSIYPKLIIWNGRSFRVLKVGLHHTFREGRVLYHVFCVTTPTLFMKLLLNTENLHWKLKEVWDGL